MSAGENPPSDFDGPWKTAIELYLREVLAFCFPAVMRRSTGRRATSGGIRAAVVPDDERAKVEPWMSWWRCKGAMGRRRWCCSIWEVQSQYDHRFAQRMFRYYSRLYDRYLVPIISLAILGMSRQQVGNRMLLGRACGAANSISDGRSSKWRPWIGRCWSGTTTLARW
ncbi:MAG: hypothetical protein U0232_17095 [Thermomicrobiales bacterium]